jgi:hypothetical protein
MVDFTSALNKKVMDVEKPKPRPIGSYLSMIQGMPKQKTVVVQGEEKPIVSFSVKLLQPKEDVDAEELAAHGDVSAWPPFNRDFWIDTPEGEWALRQFLVGTLDLEAGKNTTLGELCAQSPGRQLVSTLGHRPFVNKSGEAEIATEIKATAKA